MLICFKKAKIIKFDWGFQIKLHFCGIKENIELTNF